MKAKSPMEVYGILPRANCGGCGEKTCMGFATLLMERKKKIEDCPQILESKYLKEKERLIELLAPEIREIEIGVGARKKKIGGEDVLHRHESTFYNPTMLSYDVWDTMPENSLKERVHQITEWKKFYVGDFLKLDGIAIRSVSNDPETFAKCIKTVSEETDLPLILCSLSPKVLEAGIKTSFEKNPLIYAATKENWKEVAELAREYKVAVTLFAKNDLNMLKSLVITFLKLGISDLVLDPGTYPTGKGLEETFANFAKLRIAAIAGGEKEISYPLMSVPMTSWLIYDDPIKASYWETVVANIFIIKYADMMILHSIEPYSLIPETTLVRNIYTDPRRPVSVEAGLKVLGEPIDISPLFMTTNFALTYYTVEGDITSNKIDSYLLVVDTEGLGVEPAVAGGQLSTAKVKEALEISEAKDKVKHNTLVIPGLAARLSGEIEEATGWNVLVGPKDSGEIPRWMEKSWKEG